MLARFRLRPRLMSGGPAQFRGGAWLEETRVLGGGCEGGASDVVRVVGRFEGGEHGGHAGVGAFEDGLPLVTGAREENFL